MKNIIIIILVLASIFFIYDMITRESKIIKVPIIVEVPVPSVEGTSDTIYKPYPVYINNPIDELLLLENKELLDKYNKADSISKLKIYEDAISIREYKQEFIDTFQTINVYTKTRGELLEQSIFYKTKPYSITLDTILDVSVKGKFKVLGQLEVGTPIFSNNNFSTIVVKPSVILQNSKDNGLSISIDSRGNGWLGAIIKF